MSKAVIGTFTPITGTFRGLIVNDTDAAKVIEDIAGTIARHDVLTGLFALSLLGTVTDMPALPEDVIGVYALTEDALHYTDAAGNVTEVEWADMAPIYDDAPAA